MRIVKLFTTLILLLTFVAGANAWSDKPVCESGFTSDKATNVKSFEQLADVVANNDKVVVMVRSVYCPACCSIKPVLERIVEKYSHIAFVNAEISVIGDDSKVILDLMKVEGIPALGLFLKGKHMVTIYPTEDIRKAITLLHLFNKVDPDELSKNLEEQN